MIANALLCAESRDPSPAPRARELQGPHGTNRSTPREATAGQTVVTSER